MDRSAGQWFVLHVLSNQEKRVVENIKAALKKEETALPVYEIVIPVEKVTSLKKGDKKVKTLERKLFPGYVYVRLDLYHADGSLNEKVWFFMRGVQGVISFIGGTLRPQPLSPSEVTDLIRIIDDPGDGSVHAKPPVSVGDTVRINDGPFANFEGVIKKVDTERGKLELDVSIFGRSTPVEAEFWQVEREQD